MKIALKHTLKNVLKKPLRTLLVLFCVMICSFSALLSFDMSGALKGMFRNLFGQYLGSMDVLVSGTDFDESLLTDPEMPEGTRIAIYVSSNNFIHELEGQYTYVEQDTINILGFDTKAAGEIGMIPINRALSENEAVLSKDFADKYGYSEGEPILLHDVKKGAHEYTVASVVDSHGKGVMAQNTIVLSVDGMSVLNPDMKIAQVAIDVKNDKEVSETIEYLNENYPNLNAQSLFNNEDMNRSIDDLARLFFVLFAVCVLMVIFVTISISERIISERMSVVGTFRSLGFSTRRTTFLLLLENAFYGLIGSVAGCLMYAFLRDVIIRSMVRVQDGGGTPVDITLGKISPFLIAAIIASAILIECVCPIKEVIRAVKTPIRDIIFSNKDTEYKTNRVATVIGIAFAAVSLGLAFFPTEFFTGIIRFALMTVSLSFLFPHFLRFASKLLRCRFDQTGKPVAKLAVTEVYTKKSTVGSSVLITTAAALSIVVYTIATSLSGMIDTRFFSSEVYVETNATQKTAYFRFVEDLPDVKGTEYLYSSTDHLTINGALTKNITILSVDDNGYDSFTGIPGVPVLSDDEISISTTMAQKYDLRVGSPVTVTFQTESYYPIEKTFTVVHLCNTTVFDASGTTLILSEKTVKNIYGDYPRMLLIRTDQPVKVDELIEKYAKGAYAFSFTGEEFDADTKSNNAGILSIVTLSIILGVSLTFIGSVSNLLIGFEGRKRECAILLSTSLSRKQLTRMFLLESLFSSGIALLAAVPMGLLMIRPISSALSSITANVEVTTGLAEYILFVVVLWLIFILTSVFPIHAAGKMKLSEQLKYE
ncbi:MAG: FtsX-like permease family protein [Oscillospiraceae bacterium]|nr:FtsX-like permease family protein [Oscillospiraceae bacterium]